MSIVLKKSGKLFWKMMFCSISWLFSREPCFLLFLLIFARKDIMSLCILYCGMWPRVIQTFSVYGFLSIRFGLTEFQGVNWHFGSHQVCSRGLIECIFLWYWHFNWSPGRAFGHAFIDSNAYNECKNLV